jgi:galactokinase
MLSPAVVGSIASSLIRSNPNVQRAKQAMIEDVISRQPTADLLSNRFKKMFGGNLRIFRAPGRVNLIGEHTDYNDGLVMPAAIGLYAWIAAGRREDGLLEAYSDHFDEKVTLSLDALDGPPRRHWSDLVRGVAAILQRAGHKLTGADLMIHGEVPLGAGLSSSAALEVATALALTTTSGVDLPRLEMAKLCQAAEHEYVGTRCGIMDQFIAAFGAAGNALMLDCRSLAFQLLPVPHDVRLVVCNSMVRHELASGEYNRRRVDCETGVRILGEALPEVCALRDVTLSDLERHCGLLTPTIYRRCRHVISENRRVLDAADALHSKDVARFGCLMYESHASLRDDYEVSSKELDLLVELARSGRGVYGARMTGGGFGGCTVNLVQSESADDFRAHIAKHYREATGKSPDIYVCQPAQGAEAWSIEKPSRF